jgi:hypothetical protein
MMLSYLWLVETSLGPRGCCIIRLINEENVLRIFRTYCAVNDKVAELMK